MDFYIKDTEGNTIATFTYLTSTKDCSTCKAIVVKAESLISKNAYCKERFKDCKTIDDERKRIIESVKVEEHDEEYYVIKEDIVFSSPYIAVSVILGHTEKEAWNLLINEENQTLMDVYRH